MPCVGTPEAATDLGQEHDITVLPLTRLAKGEAPSTVLKARALAPPGSFGGPTRT
ncbi:MAG: hypothetical protein ABSC65_26915 [Acidobacteriaceae bacterium]|jgi:hypothetical protein